MELNKHVNYYRVLDNAVDVFNAMKALQEKVEKFGYSYTENGMSKFLAFPKETLMQLTNARTVFQNRGVVVGEHELVGSRDTINHVSHLTKNIIAEVARLEFRGAESGNSVTKLKLLAIDIVALCDKINVISEVAVEKIDYVTAQSIVDKGYY